MQSGKQHAKHILLKSKSEINQKFKTEYPTCTYRQSTLKREFPPYAAKPTPHDLQWNTCVVQTNVRCTVKPVYSGHAI